MEKYMNPDLTPKERAKDLLEKLSIDEKMAQITCVMPQNIDVEQINDQIPHGIGQISTLQVRLIEGLENAAQWQRKVQDMVMANSEHHIPAVFHMEGLCGPFIDGSMSFPSGISRGS